MIKILILIIIIISLLLITRLTDHPSLQVRKPCAIVADSEESTGKYREYTVRCLEYTGKIK
jgi:hypothetical protein